MVTFFKRSVHQTREYVFNRAPGPEGQPPPVKQQQPPQQQQPPPQDQQQQLKTFPYDPYPIRNATYDNVDTRQVQSPTNRQETSTVRIPTPKVASTTRDPFNDPNRYRIPSQQETADNVRFVNGRPYR